MTEIHTTPDPRNATYPLGIERQSHITGVYYRTIRCYRNLENTLTTSSSTPHTQNQIEIVRVVFPIATIRIDYSKICLSV